MDDLLLGYALKALSPAETAAAERLLATDPAAERKLARLRHFLAPLAADADFAPPPGLAIDAIQRVAAYAIEHKIPLEDPPPDVSPEKPVYASDFHPILGLAPDATFEELPPPVTPRASYPVRRWVELGLTAAVALVAVGMVVTGVMKLRHESQVAACKQNLQTLHAGLSGYADTHDDQYPKIGSPAAPTAGAFVSELVTAGHLASTVKGICPTELEKNTGLTQVAYAYTLGYRSPAGDVLGIRRRVDGVSDELTPLLADLPTRLASPTDGPLSPHGRGQNILYSDGHVTFSRLATVGPNGDHIYTNQDGAVRAGLHRLDASLGRATDVP
jgi:prepilin-type processing-associated H-X9-DG protein